MVFGVNKLAPEQVCHSVAQFFPDNYHTIAVSDNMVGEGGAKSTMGITYLLTYLLHGAESFLRS